MRVDPVLETPRLFGFLLALARVSGVFAFAPLPGFQAGPPRARIVLSLVVSFALFPVLPGTNLTLATPPSLLLWLLPETALGIAIGLAVALVLEAFVMAAQILSLNAGFSFAQTIDPTSQAESGVLLVFAQFAGGLLFLALGFDREVIRLLAGSFVTHPAGAWLAGLGAQSLLRLGADMLALAVRLSLPVVALLLLVDLALGLLGRLNAQLQLLTLSFPIKMTAAVLLLGWLTTLLPRLLVPYGGMIFGTLRRALRL